MTALNFSLGVPPYIWLSSKSERIYDMISFSSGTYFLMTLLIRDSWGFS